MGTSEEELDQGARRGRPEIEVQRYVKNSGWQLSALLRRLQLWSAADLRSEPGTNLMIQRDSVRPLRLAPRRACGYRFAANAGCCSRRHGPCSTSFRRRPTETPKRHTNYQCNNNIHHDPAARKENTSQMNMKSRGILLFQKKLTELATSNIDTKLRETKAEKKKN